MTETDLKTNLKTLIRVVRAAQHEGYGVISSPNSNREWRELMLLEAASGVLVLRALSDLAPEWADQIQLTLYCGFKKPSQNLVVVAAEAVNEWVSVPLSIFTGAVGAHLAARALEFGPARDVATYHESDKFRARDDEGIQALLCENDDQLWCLLWSVMNRPVDQFHLPQVLSFQKGGDTQRGALSERLSLMGNVATYQEMADANLIP